MNQTRPDNQPDPTSYWADLFDTQVEKYPDDAVKALNFSNTRLMNQVHWEVLSCIDWSQLFSGDHLLDTGCGTGVLLNRLVSSIGGGRRFSVMPPISPGACSIKPGPRSNRRFQTETGAGFIA